VTKNDDSPGAGGSRRTPATKPAPQQPGRRPGAWPAAQPVPAQDSAPVPQPSPAPQPAGSESSGVDLARVALRAAKEQARARGAAAVQKKQARRGGLRSGARADGRDPLPLGAAINRLITERGWEAPAAVGGVMGRWPQLVGQEVAQHCAPARYDEEERVLTVQCDSTAWATQLRLLAPTLVARLNADLGHGTVKLIKVLGPAGPPRSYGRLRAPGSRGPGDTYG
jgi:predicted nucleic acid-binding Zn ribbon protein